MHLAKIIFAFSMPLISSLVIAQNVILSLDTNPKSRCDKSGKGGVWILRDTRVNAPPGINNTQTGLLPVSVLRFDGSGHLPQKSVQYLSSGQTVELGCSEDQPTGVSYQLVQ